MLCTWEERFTASDIETRRKPGDSLRVLSTNPTLIRRILLWLQRDYIASKFPGYDPTSDRDDDLPIDLDHLIPQDLFGFNWKGVSAKLDSDVTEDNVISDNFWRFRYTVGNSLGNYRWISSTENRGLMQQRDKIHRSGVSQQQAKQKPCRRLRCHPRACLQTLLIQCMLLAHKQRRLE